MPRRKHVQIVGKEAAFEVDAWAKAVLALAEQLHREWKETGQWPDQSDQGGPEFGREG